MTWTCPTCQHTEDQPLATAVAHKCPRRGNRVVQLQETPR